MGEGWRAERPLAAYGTVELLVGLSSLLVTWTLFTHQDFYLSMSGSPTAALVPGRLAAQFTVCLALIGIPTALMGMTLPLLSQLVADRRQVSALYGVNTIGAATGSLLASFVLIYYIGCIRAGAVAAAINGLIFIITLLSNRFFPATVEAPASGGPCLRMAPQQAQDGQLISRPLLLTLAIFSGFVVLSCEITWTRFLSLCFGNRIYVTSITLAIILLFMGQAARIGERDAAGDDAAVAHPAVCLLADIDLLLGRVPLGAVGLPADGAGAGGPLHPDDGGVPGDSARADLPADAGGAARGR